jgi:hypothetical protein
MPLNADWIREDCFYREDRDLVFVIWKERE